MNLLVCVQFTFLIKNNFNDFLMVNDEYSEQADEFVYFRNMFTKDEKADIERRYMN